MRRLWLALHGYGQLAARFVQRCGALAAADALVVVPEALSRFYVTGDVHAHARARIGGSWMTREDRLAEIADYVAYLDLLYRRVTEEQPRTPAEPCVLGFSQGAATAVRWTVLGAAPVRRLVLWGGSLPPDVDLVAHRERLSRARIALVFGAHDPAHDEAAARAEAARLGEQGIDAEVRGHDGAHHLDDRLLRSLAES